MSHPSWSDAPEDEVSLGTSVKNLGLIYLAVTEDRCDRQEDPGGPWVWEVFDFTGIPLARGRKAAKEYAQHAADSAAEKFIRTAWQMMGAVK